MTHRFVCSRGHDWEPPVDADPGDTNPLCPHCLAPGTLQRRANDEPTDQNRPGERPIDNSPLTEPPTGPLVPLAAATVPPPELPGYQILGSLARGGLGVVYKAIDQKNRRTVAVKVIRPDLISQSDVVRRFRREAKAAARLTHPNIVAVHDTDEYAGIPYIVMEFIEGTDLNQLVEQRGRLPVSWACEFIRQAALGLQHAHDCGLVHRDVKPSNLIVAPPPPAADPRGREPVEAPTGFTVKVLDLGVARVVQTAEEEGGMTVLTQAGGIVGTPDYMAPEQVEAPQLVDARADVYSLGATLYFLLAAAPPFPGSGFYQKLARLQVLEPTPIETLRPGLPPALATVVRKAMAKQPAERFATAAALAAALTRAAALLGEPTAEVPAAPDATAPGNAKAAAAAPRDVIARDVKSTVLKEQQEGPAAAPRVFVAGAVDPLKLTPTRLQGHIDSVTCVAFTADGERLASGGRDGVVRIWDPAAGQELRVLRAGGGGVICLAFLPRDWTLAVGCRDGTLQFWDAGTGKRHTQVGAHTGPVESLAFTPDARRLVTAGQDQSLKLWNAETGRLTRRLGGQVVERHWHAVLSVAVLPDGRRAVSGSRDLTLKLWDLETGRELRTYRGARSEVTCVAVTPDGKFALSGGGNRLRMWPLEGGDPQLMKGHDAAIRAVAVAPDGRFAATGGEDQTVRLWELATGRLVHTFTASQQGAALGVAFSPDGKRIAAGGADRVVCVWRVPVVG